MSVPELRTLAKSLKIKGASTARKQDLITLIEAHQKAAAVPEVKVDMVDMVDANVVPEVKVKVDVSKTKSRQPSSWNQFLSEYRSAHNCSLKEAMTKKDEYLSYKEKKGN
jgi:hypothetical protein